jgi:hypothetical protein
MLKLFNEPKNLLNRKNVVFLCHYGKHLIKKGMAKVGRKMKSDPKYSSVDFYCCCLYEIRYIYEKNC